MDFSVATIVLWAVPVVFAITLHEAAHGYVAKLFGDRTAEELMTPRVKIETLATDATVADLIDWLARDSAVHADAFVDRARLRAAVDQVFVPLDALLGNAREVAIFPPVTGG